MIVILSTNLKIGGIMKKLFYLSFMLIGLFFVQPSNAQVNVNINVGSQPLWGPVGYDYVRYYYLPEADVYYNVASRKYTYFQGNRWVTKSKLPGRYKNFDVYRTYKVVINDRDPWRHHKSNRSRYGHYASHRNQHIIRDSRHSKGRPVVERRAPSKHVKHYKKVKNNKKNNKHHKHDHRR